MTLLRYTLLSDGSSDAALLPIIDWVIASHRPDIGVIGQAADRLDTLDRSLSKRIPAAISIYPCDILFIHRDAEADPLSDRLNEITSAVEQLQVSYVPIIPIRMTEAWLLSDESAIRSAAENKNGTMELALPAKKTWENLVDPKRVLFDALTKASGKNGRALAKFNPHRQRHLVAQRTSEFVGLRGMKSFDSFEAHIVEKLKDF